MKKYIGETIRIKGKDGHSELMVLGSIKEA